MSTLRVTPEDRLREVMYRIPYREFSKNVIQKALYSPEFIKLFQRGVSTLTTDEKTRLANLVVDTVGRDNLILPLSDSALTVYVVATVVRMARH